MSNLITVFNGEIHFSQIGYGEVRFLGELITRRSYFIWKF